MQQMNRATARKQSKGQFTAICNDNLTKPSRFQAQSHVALGSAVAFIFHIAVFVVLSVSLVGCGSQKQADSTGNLSSDTSSTSKESTASTITESSVSEQSASTQSDNTAKIEDKTSTKDDSSSETSKSENAKSESSSSTTKSENVKVVNLGETIVTDNYEITLTSAEWLDEIYPPDVSGFYRYYEDEDGKTYYLIKGTYKNKWSDYTEPHWATEAKLTFNNKYNFDCQIEAIQDGKMSTSYPINPMESCEIYIWASISDEIKDSTTATKLIWHIPRDNYNNFYQSRSPNDVYEVVTKADS